MVEPKPMVQADEAPSESNWAPQPVYIANVGGGSAPGPEGIEWSNEEGTEFYSLDRSQVSGYTEDGGGAFTLGTWGTLEYRHSMETPWVTYTFPEESGTLATQEWVQAQIAAALA